MARGTSSKLFLVDLVEDLLVNFGGGGNGTWSVLRIYKNAVILEFGGCESSVIAMELEFSEGETFSNTVIFEFGGYEISVNIVALEILRYWNLIYYLPWKDQLFLNL